MVKQLTKEEKDEKAAKLVAEIEKTKADLDQILSYEQSARYYALIEQYFRLYPKMITPPFLVDWSFAGKLDVNTYVSILKLRYEGPVQKGEYPEVATEIIWELRLALALLNRFGIFSTGRFRNSVECVDRLDDFIGGGARRAGRLKEL